MRNKSFILVIIGITALFAVFTLFNNEESISNPSADSKQQQTLSDVHGLEVAIDNPDKLYLPNHQGLYFQEEDGRIQKVGSINDDFMGFTVSPSEPSVFYASGHPRTGGNFGIIKTSDGGTSWEDISEGLDGPVDFHTMAIDNTDDQLLYGYYHGALQRSTDAGTSWQYLENAPDQIIQLSAGENEGQLYASTVSGLFVSQDKGSSWDAVKAINETVTAIEINPTSGQMFAYGVNSGLLISTDSGVSWEKTSFGSEGEQVLYIASSKSDPEQVYLITKSLGIYKSTDSGETWNLR
jgi:photosystem II stability/assembly factor-like uncharacterized protein